MTMKYRQFFTSQREFLRSTRIDLDKEKPHMKFVTTPLFIHVLSRVLQGLTNDGPRAISVTGPYGTGKSTTILQLIQLLENGDHSRFETLQSEYAELGAHSELPSVVAIPVNGASESIASNLLCSISRWASAYSDFDLVNAVEHTDSNDLNAIVNLIDMVKNRHSDKSILIVIDELGKHLEYASSHPDNNDVYLLQLLAEYVDRSSGPNMMLITILHQAFESYGNRLLRSQREEFAKIQGRFEDIPFQLPMEDTLRIIGLAVSSMCSDSVGLEPARQVAERIGSELYEVGAVSETISKSDYLSLCRQCAPLHPITALLMGPLFRHFSQNERSLFSMLASTEPFGFQRFLDDTDFDTESPSLYDLSDLYEYVGTSLGSSIYHSTFGRRWAIIETALGRVPDSKLSARDLVRAIGLISAVPLHRLVASRRTLSLAGHPTALDNDLQLLTTRSIIVHRRFFNSYRLWDGSDIDIESLIEEARRSIGVPPLVESLKELAPPRPITARKHTMQTGALRWFEMTYLSLDDLDRIQNDARPSNGDGRVYVVISTTEDSIPTLPDLKPWQLVLHTLVSTSLLEAVGELYYVKWVIENTPALLDDEVARREVTEREHDLEQLIERMVNGAILSPKTTVTFYTHDTSRGEIEGKRINALVSALCDALYPMAPQIVNEFVNRDVMSSAATAARNDVLKRMIDFPEEENLGITGFPPKLPIYLSTLKVTGLHRQVNGQWKICAPNVNSTWFDSWNYLVDKTKDEYCPIGELWQDLSFPPYGIRKGLLPILTVAFMCENRNRISIMEKDVFVPELSTAIVERLLRNPEHFMIRLSEISGHKRIFLETMVRDGALAEFDGTTDLMSLVRPLISFALRLPEYTRNTKLLSSQTTLVRQALINAKEPAQLLFHDLPTAVGYTLIDDSEEFSISTVVSSIISSIRELADCYPKLLREIEATIFEAFGIHESNTDVARNQIRQRAGLLQTVTNEMNLKAVAWRMSQDIEPENWIESVASVIMKRTPRNWFDKTLDQFRMELVLVERKFVHYETLASLHGNNTQSPSPLRLGLTTGDIDFETLVNTSDVEQEQIQSTVQELVSQFEAGELRGNQLLLIASELIKAYHSSSEIKEVESRG